ARALDAGKKEHDALRAEHVPVTEKIKQLSDELAAAKNGLAVAKNEVVTAKNELAALTAEHETTRADKLKLSEQLDKQKQQNTALSSQLSTAWSRVEQLTAAEVRATAAV